MPLVAALLLSAAPVPLAGPVSPSAAGGGTLWYVDDDATSFGTGTAADPFISVTYAVSRPEVSSGDVVVVLPGDYLNEAIRVEGRQLTIVSSDGAGATTLYGPDLPFGGRSSILFAEGAATQVAVQGFRFTGGTGSLEASGFLEPVGGAVSVTGGARVSLHGCEFEGNTAARGGDVYARGAAVAAVDCAFLGPGTDARGEAIYARDASLTATGCTFVDLRSGPAGAPEGGGAVLVEHSTALIADSEFAANGSDLFGAHVWGRSASVRLESCDLRGGTAFAGGAVAMLGGELSMADTVVEDNVAIASPGGGLFASGADVDLARCAFRGNEIQGAREGGAVALLVSRLVAADSAFTGNVADRGGAVDVGITSSASFTGCRFADNRARADGAALIGAVEARRCVFAGNRVDGPSGTPPGSAVLSGRGVLERCTIVGNASGEAAVRGRFVVEASIAWANAPRDVVTSAGVSRSIVGALQAPRGMVVWTSRADPLLWSEESPELMPGSPAIDALPGEFGLDPDGSAREIGADVYSVFDRAPGFAQDLGSVACAGATNSTGGAASLSAVGALERASDRLVVAGAGFPPGAPAIVLASTTVGATPLPASAGPLCIAGSLVRVTPEASFTRPDGTFAARVPVARPPFSGGAGGTWTLQVWFRDAVGGSTSGVSAGRTVTLTP